MREKITQVFGTCLGLILVPILIGWGMSLSKKHEEKYPWKASLFYKSGNVIDSKDVKTVEECRNWATDKARGMSMKDDAWDYSCGKGCTFNDDKISGGKEIHTYNCAEMSK
jgi:hypothetical protein